MQGQDHQRALSVGASIGRPISRQARQGNENQDANVKRSNQCNSESNGRPIAVTEQRDSIVRNTENGVCILACCYNVPRSFFTIASFFEVSAIPRRAPVVDSYEI